MPGGDHNPLLSDFPSSWEHLLEAIGPASLLAVIELRMGGVLRARYAPEDVLQEALLHAWRDRAGHEWRGLRRFRNWLLTIIDHRLQDLADCCGAQKRGCAQLAIPLSELRDGSQHAAPPAWDSTTPSRIAVYREQAAAMRTALETLPDDVRDVVRLRLLEQRPIEEIAERLHLGPSAVRHRFRRGAELYQRRLITELATQTDSISPAAARILLSESAPDV